MISLVLATYRPGGFDFFVKSFNGKEELGSYEVIVVDDWPGRAGTLVVPDYFKEKGINLGWYGKSKSKSYPETKGGLANAWNTALLHAKGDYVVFISDYATLTPGWIGQWEEIRRIRGDNYLISGGAILYECPRPNAPGPIKTWVDEGWEWETAKGVHPKSPWVAWEWENFYAGMSTEFLTRCNGLDERADHCHCWLVSSQRVQAKALGYQLVVVPELTCYMVDHREWEKGDAPAPAGCGGEGLWRITERQSLEKEPEWVGFAPNPFDLKHARAGKIMIDDLQAEPARPTARCLEATWAWAEMLVNPLHEELVRECLAYDMMCPLSSRWTIDNDTAGVTIAYLPAALSWSRKFEWPWAIQKADLQWDHTVLDAGSGHSVFKYAVGARVKEVHSLDSDSKEFPTIAGCRPFRTVNNVKLVAGDIRKLPYPDGTFDSVICVSVLEHTQDHFECIEELIRVTKRGRPVLLTIDVRFEGESDEFAIDLPMAREIVARYGGTIGEHRQTLCQTFHEGRVKLFCLCIKLVKNA